MTESAKPGLFRRLWRFLVLTLRTLFVLFFLLPLGFFIYSWVAAPDLTIEDGIVLVWAPEGVILERNEFDPTEIVAQQVLGEAPPYSLQYDLLRSLDLAAQDSRIKALYLKLDDLEYAGVAQLEELAQAIADFRHSGKPVYTWATEFNQSQYFLASQADTVLLDPLGGIWLEGFDFYQQYFKDVIDKLGVDVHVFRAGKYKSAVEPFERNDMSPEARAANQAWLGTQWDLYVQGIASARAMSVQAVNAYVLSFPQKMGELLGDAAALAKQAGLVDDLATRDQVRDKLRELVGIDPEHGSFRQIDNMTYLAARANEDRKLAPKHRIGYLVAQGALIDGESGRGTTGSDSLAWQIEDARRNEEIEALVLRVDSPGGSVTAAEAIRRELELFRRSGKPLVVSMSSLAASGGYWIAIESDRVFSNAATLTGSIGVFGILPTFQRPLDKLGVHTDGLGTTPYAGAARGDRPLSPELAAAMQSGVDFYYRQFVARVAVARELPVETALQVAEGRVWSGADAMKVGLVDQIGGLPDAIQTVAKLADFQPGDYQVVPLDAAPDWRTAIYDLISIKWSGLMSAMLQGDVKAAWPQLSAALGLPWLRNERGVYAWCGCDSTQTH